MITKHENGTISVKGASYDLLIRGHIIDVIISGVAFASLDIRTSVNQTNDDLSVTTDVEDALRDMAVWIVLTTLPVICLKKASAVVTSSLTDLFLTKHPVIQRRTIPSVPACPVIAAVRKTVS